MLFRSFQGRWAKEPAITQLRSDLAEILDSAGGVMSASELAEAILLARGSIEDEPERTRLATAVVRAAVEVERTMTAPRFLVRRVTSNGSGHRSAISGQPETDKLTADKLIADRLVVALSQELGRYAVRLGDEADKLADEDPLIPPARVTQRLRAISLPTGASMLSDARILRLAAAASLHAAVSSRQELYPRGMEAARALKLSQGALYGVAFLTVEQIHDRVGSRYPEATPLPDRPALD